MDKLTRKEQAWVDEVNEVLARCPSKNLCFYTIGDPVVGIYLKKRQAACEEANDDLVRVLGRNNWNVDAELRFPATVEGVCG